MDQNPLSGRPDRTTLILASIVGGVTVLMLGAVYLMMGGSDSPSLRKGKGSVFEAPAPRGGTAALGAPAAPVAFTPPGQSEPAPPPAGPGSDSLSFVTNKQGSALGGGPRTAAPEQLAREKAFVSQNEGLIKKCREDITASLLRQWKVHPVIREIDAELSAMPNLMAIKRRYQNNNDMFGYVREMVSQPELRATIRKYMAKPEAWATGVDLALDVLKAAPKPLYSEFARMAASDQSTRDFINAMATDGAAYLPGAMTAAISQGKDIAPLKKAMSDFSVNK